MNHHITHPTKEQVRAYMAERELARRPPPAPDEIRRKLGWRLAPASKPDVLSLWLLLAQLALDYLYATTRSPFRRRD